MTGSFLSDYKPSLLDKPCEGGFRRRRRGEEQRGSEEEEEDGGVECGLREKKMSTPAGPTGEERRTTTSLSSSSSSSSFSAPSPDIRDRLFNVTSPSPPPSPPPPRLLLLSSSSRVSLPLSAESHRSSSHSPENSRRNGADLSLLSSSSSSCSLPSPPRTPLSSKAPSNCSSADCAELTQEEEEEEEEREREEEDFAGDGHRLPRGDEDDDDDDQEEEEDVVVGSSCFSFSSCSDVLSEEEEEREKEKKEEEEELADEESLLEPGERDKKSSPDRRRAGGGGEGGEEARGRRRRRGVDGEGRGGLKRRLTDLVKSGVRYTDEEVFALIAHVLLGEKKFRLGTNVFLEEEEEGEEGGGRGRAADVIDSSGSEERTSFLLKTEERDEKEEQEEEEKEEGEDWIASREKVIGQSTPLQHRGVCKPADFERSSLSLLKFLTFHCCGLLEEEEEQEREGNLACSFPSSSCSLQGLPFLSTLRASRLASLLSKKRRKIAHPDEWIFRFLQRQEKLRRHHQCQARCTYTQPKRQSKADRRTSEDEEEEPGRKKEEEEKDMQRSTATTTSQSSHEEDALLLRQGEVKRRVPLSEEASPNFQENAPLEPSGHPSEKRTEHVETARHFLLQSSSSSSSSCFSSWFRSVYVRACLFSVLRRSFMRNARTQKILTLCQFLNVLQNLELQDLFVELLFNTPPLRDFPPPKTNTVNLLKCMYTAAELQGLPLSDTFAETVFQHLGAYSRSEELNERPYVSYEALDAAGAERPQVFTFRIMPYRNELGLRTWTAGLFLAEYLSTYGHDLGCLSCLFSSSSSSSRPPSCHCCQLLSSSSSSLSATSPLLSLPSKTRSSSPRLADHDRHASSSSRALRPRSASSSSSCSSPGKCRASPSSSSFWLHALLNTVLSSSKRKGRRRRSQRRRISHSLPVETNAKETSSSVASSKSTYLPLDTSVSSASPLSSSSSSYSSSSSSSSSDQMPLPHSRQHHCRCLASSSSSSLFSTGLPVCCSSSSSSRRLLSSPPYGVLELGGGMGLTSSVLCSPQGKRRGARQNLSADSVHRPPMAKIPFTSSPLQRKHERHQRKDEEEEKNSVLEQDLEDKKILPRSLPKSLPSTHPSSSSSSSSSLSPASWRTRLQGCGVYFATDYLPSVLAICGENLVRNGVSLESSHPQGMKTFPGPSFSSPPDGEYIHEDALDSPLPPPSKENQRGSLLPPSASPPTSSSSSCQRSDEEAQRVETREALLNGGSEEEKKAGGEEEKKKEKKKEWETKRREELQGRRERRVFDRDSRMAGEERRHGSLALRDEETNEKKTKEEDPRSVRESARGRFPSSGFPGDTDSQEEEGEEEEKEGGHEHKDRKESEREDRPLRGEEEEVKRTSAEGMAIRSGNSSSRPAEAEHPPREEESGRARDCLWSSSTPSPVSPEVHLELFDFAHVENRGIGLLRKISHAMSSRQRGGTEGAKPAREASSRVKESHGQCAAGLQSRELGDGKLTEMRSSKQPKKDEEDWRKKEEKEEQEQTRSPVRIKEKNKDRRPRNADEEAETGGDRRRSPSLSRPCSTIPARQVSLSSSFSSLCTPTSSGGAERRREEHEEEEEAEGPLFIVGSDLIYDENLNVLLARTLSTLLRGRLEKEEFLVESGDVEAVTGGGGGRTSGREGGRRTRW